MARSNGTGTPAGPGRNKPKPNRQPGSYSRPAAQRQTKLTQRVLRAAADLAAPYRPR